MRRFRPAPGWHPLPLLCYTRKHVPAPGSPMSLADLPASPVSVASLADSGLLPGEIAAALGMSEGQVLAELGEAWVSSAHVARVEAALLDQAIGGTTWRESPDKLGGVIRLESDRRPDVQAAKALLAARMPERYGNTEPVRLAPAPLQVTIRVVTANGQPTGRVIEGEASETADDDGPALVGDDRDRQGGGGSRNAGEVGGA